MGIRFIRQPSATPNVSNADDARMVRYAYGGYDGYVKDKGSELSYTMDGSIFRINSGVISLQGYESEIDTNGVDISFAGLKNVWMLVYYEVNLATQTVEIKSKYSASGIPALDAGDDLTKISTGVARMKIYSFYVTQDTEVTQIVKDVSEIKYLKTIIENIQMKQLFYNDDGINIASEEPKIIFKNQESLIGKKLKLEIGNKKNGKKSSSQFFEVKFENSINDLLTFFYVSDYGNDYLVIGDIAAGISGTSAEEFACVASLKKIGLEEGDPDFNPGPHFTSSSMSWEKYIFGVWEMTE